MSALRRGSSYYACSEKSKVCHLSRCLFPRTQVSEVLWGTRLLPNLFSLPPPLGVCVLFGQHVLWNFSATPEPPFPVPAHFCFGCQLVCVPSSTRIGWVFVKQVLSSLGRQILAAKGALSSSVTQDHGVEVREASHFLRQSYGLADV